MTESGVCVPPGASRNARRAIERGEARAHGRHVEGDGAHRCEELPLAGLVEARLGERLGLLERVADRLRERPEPQPRADGLAHVDARKLATSGFPPGATQRGRSLQASTPFSTR